jgi:hypothetical protein
MSALAVLIRCIPGHLGHPLFRGVPSDAGQIYSPGFQIQEEQHVVRDQAAPGRYFHAKEIDPGQHRHVRCNKILPPGVGTPLPCWRDSIPVEDIAHRLIR